MSDAVTYLFYLERTIRKMRNRLQLSGVASADAPLMRLCKPFHPRSPRLLIASFRHIQDNYKTRLINTALSSTGPSGEGTASNSAFDIVFGKPSAPRELYERIANDSRESSWGLLARHA
jgi:hypothetical protein